jgi:hypothetical protein
MGVLIWLQLVSRCSDLLDWAIIYKARQASVCIGRTRAYYKYADGNAILPRTICQQYFSVWVYQISLTWLNYHHSSVLSSTHDMAIW